LLNRMENYEELYRMRWESQTKKDKIINPKLETKNGAKIKPAPKKLTKDAEMLNKLLKKELSLKDASDIMSLSLNSLRQIKLIYKLPRTVK